MTLHIILGVSLLVNLLLIWYLTSLLRKFFFVSSSIGDLYLTLKAFRLFVKSLYSMNSYHGEPMIQELIHRVKDVNEEIETFREIFEYVLDEEIEEELNAAEEEASSTH